MRDKKEIVREKEIIEEQMELLWREYKLQLRLDERGEDAARQEYELLRARRQSLKWVLGEDIDLRLRDEMKKW